MMNKSLPLNPFGIENPVAGAITGIVIRRRTIIWLRLALALDFVVVITVHVMIARWFFVVVVDAVMIGRRRCIRGRASGPHIVVVVMGRIIIIMKVVVVEHRHELFVVEPVEVVVSDVVLACDDGSF